MCPPDNSPRTFVLKLNLHCNFCGGCVKKVMDVVRKIQGVHSIDVDIEEGVATISGNVDPHTVIKELEKDKKINVKLVGKDKRLSTINKQKLQTMLLQNHGCKSPGVSPQLLERGKATVSGEMMKSMIGSSKLSQQSISSQNCGSTSPGVSPQLLERGKATVSGKMMKSMISSSKLSQQGISSQNHGCTSPGVSPQLLERGKAPVSREMMKSMISSSKVGQQSISSQNHGCTSPGVLPQLLERGKATVSGEMMKSMISSSKLSQRSISSQNHGCTSPGVSPQLLERGKATVSGEMMKSMISSSKLSQRSISSQNHGCTSPGMSPQLLERGKATVSGEMMKSMISSSKLSQRSISSQNHGCTSPGVSPQLLERGKATVSGEMMKSMIISSKLSQRSISSQNHACTSPGVSPQLLEHKHNWELKNYNKPFKCNGCKEEGFGTRYRCEPCNHDLHKECMSLKPTIIHELFKGSTFVFSQEPGNICDACGRKIYGYSYTCKADNLDLHPRCANLRGKLCIKGTEFVLQKKVKYKCLWCKKKQPSYLEDDEVQGWCYVSKDNRFYCHVYCVSQMVNEAWRIGHLDRKHEVDDASMALEKLDLKLGASLKISGWGGGTAFSKIVAILLETVLSILLGDPTGLFFPLLAKVFAN